MKIFLELKGFCIKRGAEKRYERALKGCLAKNISEDIRAELEKEVEALKFFLEYADFSRMRAEYKELSGAENVGVTLSVDKKDYEIVLKEDIIKPYWK